MPKSTDTQLKTDLLLLVQSECRGRACGLRHELLAQRLAISKRRERRLVNELVCAGHLIGASPQWGVFWVVDEADAQAAKAALADIAYPVLRRMRAFDATWDAHFPPRQSALWEP